MDANGRLIITDAKGNEKFKGKSFEETGVAEEGLNRKERRKREAALRKERKRFEKLMRENSNG